MDTTTINQLLHINQAFYIEAATAFAETRQQPWEGWQKVLDSVKTYLPQRPHIADVGCGNGRFNHFLKGKLPDYIYTGYDSSPSLLALAQETIQTQSNARVEMWNLADTPLPAGSHHYFDWVNVYGLMHHIPSKQLRTLVLDKIVQLIKPGGVIALSFWHFDQLPQLTKRAARKHTLESLGFKPKALEAGDFLLPFGSTKNWRYCHTFTEEETEQLIVSLPLEGLSHFMADGSNQRTNEYYIGRVTET